uniref:uncharacterized protein LOC124065981 isoform X2 n=1 Tax=Scatophagus argus TaxID=75038 RepID=UPI001ED80573|nr:uncharacterized protein LOC124065981 isoform X2 [Scatophagus argus]
MDLTILNSLFVFHFVLQGVTADVEPPTNVTLHCRNMSNFVEWSYGQPVPGLRFQVRAYSRSSSPRELWVDPPASQADVSFLSDPRDSYYITVIAVVGVNKSAIAPPSGITFSYFMNSPAPQKCFLDFPPVNVTAHHDGHVQFSFVHPWLLYNHVLPGGRSSETRKKKSHNAHIREPLPELTYDGVIINEKPPQLFTCETQLCEAKLAADPADKYCLRITGVMEKMLVKATQDYCAVATSKPTHNNNIYIYVIVAILMVISGASVLFIAYRKITKPTTTLPASVTITGRLKQWTSGMVPEPVIVPEIEPTSPQPLLQGEQIVKEEKEFTFTSVTSSTETEGRLPIGVSIEDEGVCDVEDVKNEGLGYMQGSNLEGNEPEDLSEIPSGYEKREVVVEMAPDEKATGYRC